MNPIGGWGSDIDDDERGAAEAGPATGSSSSSSASAAVETADAEQRADADTLDLQKAVNESIIEAEDYKFLGSYHTDIDKI